MSKTIAVIDGNSLMHRAFHAVPPTMNAPDGTPTNAVFGFLSMFIKFYEVAKPDAIICAFDAGRPAFRMEALDQYKAQRPPMDENLKVQFPIIEDLLRSLSVPVVRIKGWEGDDILGTISARDEELGYETLLVSGDKDIYQLASDKTRVVTTKKGITDVAIYGPDEVIERYGVGPKQVPDFLGLKGDPSDNIPGVAGIGEKTAAKLLQKYGSLEGLYENLGDLKGKQLENLTTHREDAFLSRRVATIVRDLDFECDLEGATFPSYTAPQVIEAFDKVKMTSHMRHLLKLIEAGDDEGAAADGAQAAFALPKLLSGADLTAAVDAALEAGERIAVTFVEPAQQTLFDEALTVGFATADWAGALPEEGGLPLFARIVREGSWAAIDAKAALHRVYPADTAAPALVTDAEVLGARFFDVGLAAYVLGIESIAADKDALAAHCLNAALPAGKDDAENAAILAAATAAEVGPLSAELESENLTEVYDGIDRPLIGVLALMERTGAALDAAHLAAMGEVTSAELERLRAQIIDLAGEDFNVDSPKQLSHILFDVLGLKPKKKTATGYSTNAAVLKELAKRHELPALVLHYREQAKINSTYIEALPRLVGGDARLHTTFHPNVTTTGRLSSSDPNLQNIPVRTDFGRKIRECFVPLEPGSVFMSADYSQIELRLLAHLSGDEGLIAAFNSGADFHAATAAQVFGVPADEVTPQMRSRAKAVNFGIVYGQQAFGLAQSLDIPFGEARDMIERYFAAYPGVRAYLDDIVASAREEGFAITMFGRKRRIAELSSSNANQRSFGERAAMNHPMQGSAADIIKLAMRQVADRMAAEGFSAKLMLQVHDELDFSVPEGEVEALAALVREVMTGVVQLKVPLEVDVSWAANWAEAH